MNIERIFDTEENFRDYLADHIFRTDTFKRAVEDPKDVFVRPIIDQLVRTPIVFVSTEDVVETSHFTTWMRAIQLRKYDNPVISDMYYLHELWHAATMEYTPNLPWNRWFTKMVTNEFESSLASEVFVYFHYPELRKDSFPHDIWADRFLNDEEFMGRVRSSFHHFGRLSQYIIDEVSAARKRAMVTPDPFDYLELQIHNYLAQNQKFAHIWKNSYNDVETEMSRIIEKCHTTEKFNELLCDFLVNTSDLEHGIPFYNEAVQFYDVYIQGKKNYGNSVITGRD